MMENRNDKQGGEQANDSPETLTSDTAVERNPDVEQIKRDNRNVDPGPRQNAADKATEQATKQQAKREEKEADKAAKEQEKAEKKAAKEAEAS